MHHRSSVLRHLIRSLVLFGVLGAVLATALLERAAPLADARRAEAAAAAEAAVVEQDVRLVALCQTSSDFPIAAIARSFGLDPGATFPERDFRGDLDRSRFHTMSYSPISRSMVTTSRFVVDNCETRARRLGPNLNAGYAIAIGFACGIVARFGLLYLMLRARIPLGVARAISEAAGGFIAGSLSDYLQSGKFSARSFGFGLLGAITAAAGGYGSRAIIAARQTPTQTAAAVGASRGSMAPLASGISNVLRGSRFEWERIVADYLMRIR